MTNIFNTYLFEVIDRIARFFIHLKDIEAQFYYDSDKQQDKIGFIRDYESCLIELIILAKHVQEKVNSESIDVNVFLPVLAGINQRTVALHMKMLGHLPRPSEPIELRRFTRIIPKQIVNLNLGNLTSIDNFAKVSIYTSEEIGDSTYQQSPLQEFKETDLSTLKKDINNIFNSGIDLSNILHPDTKRSLHITIPRIDSNNPCCWPTIMHEVAHHVMDEFYREMPIDEDFNKHIGDGFSMDNILVQGVNLRSWLTECWCDTFAAVLMGPSFWFSQYSSFIFAFNDLEKDFKPSEKYPPHIFRLLLIDKILSHKITNSPLPSLENSQEECRKLFKELDKKFGSRFHNNSQLKNIFLLFQSYFTKHFFKADWQPTASLEKAIKYT